jgi:DNA polymerase-3 subunit gamma/tau
METYIPLTLKYRPKRWSDLVGQEVVVRTITNMISQNRLLQSIVLGGSRGIGKTTSARILARTLNCEDRDPTTLEPCGKCESCIAIADETSMSVQELDAASNGSVDDVRRIKDEVRYADSGKYRVYVIDECHSLTVQAWQAFLKLLEEPPPNVVFVFCTTEVHKIPETIISRSAHFSFARMTAKHIIQRLEYIAEQEKLQLEPGVLIHLAKHVNGGMRDAVSLLDQLVSFTNGGAITKEAVGEVVGVLNTQLLFDMFRAFVDCDVNRLYQLLQGAYTAVSDVNVLVSDMIMFYRDLMLAKAGLNIPDAQPDYQTSLEQVSDQVTLDYLIEAQTHLHFISDQLKKSRLPSRSVVDVYITRLFYGGIRQQHQQVQQPIVVQAQRPQLVPSILSPEDLAQGLEGCLMTM